MLAQTPAETEELARDELRLLGCNELDFDELMLLAREELTLLTKLDERDDELKLVAATELEETFIFRKVASSDPTSLVISSMRSTLSR